MKPKNHLDTFAVTIMVVLCALWGFQQVAIKAVIDDIPPIWQSGIRSFIAAILLGAWMIATRRPWIRGLTTPGILVGVLFAVEFALLYSSLRYTDASRVVLLLYTSPFVVAIGGHWFIAGERLSILGWLGVILAFIGTAVVLQTSTNTQVAGTQRLWGDVLALGGGIAWGATTLVVRISALSTASPAQTLWYQLFGSGILLSVLAWSVEGSFRLPQTTLGWSSMGFQIVGIATFSYMAWFALITRYSVTKIAVFSFLTPLFGALYAILLLHERVDAYHLLALLLTVAGIVLVNRYGHQKTTP